MIIKSPSKQVSQLDLKFLDLKFTAILDPNPAPPRSKNSSTTHSCADTGSMHRFALPRRGHQAPDAMPGLQNCSLKFKTSPGSRWQQPTHADSCHQSINDSTHADLDMTAENAITYLDVDSESIYRDLNSRRAELISGKKKKSTGFIVSGAADTVDREIEKYQNQIKVYQRENEMIHGEITKIYAERKKDKDYAVKSIKTMKVFNGNTQKPLFGAGETQKHYSEAAQHYKYESQDKMADKKKKQFLDKYRINASTKQPVQQQKAAQARNSSYQTSKINRVQTVQSEGQAKDHSQIENHGRRLVQNRYENFYQNLYKIDQGKMGKTDSISVLGAETHEYKGVPLQQLRKKISSTNVDKNFEAFLQQRRMRVPQFIKQLR